MIDKFPEPNRLKVNEDGVIFFTDEQWTWLVKFSKTKARTFQGQKLAVKKLVHKALYTFLEKAKHGKRNQKSR